MDHPNKTFNAHIQELAPSQGPVTVFVEELGEKWDLINFTFTLELF